MPLRGRCLDMIVPDAEERICVFIQGVTRWRGKEEKKLTSEKKTSFEASKEDSGLLLHGGDS